METDQGQSKRPGRNGLVVPPAPKGNRYAEKHGLHTMKQALTTLGSRGIDGRSSLSYALKKWRRELVADLGGEDDISTQQSALIDLTVKSKLLLDSIDAWLLIQPSLINKKKKTLLPVVIQRQVLVDSLAKYLTQLGLERRQKVKTIDDMLSGHDEAQDRVNDYDKDEVRQ